MKHKIIAVICAMDIELEGYKNLLCNSCVEQIIGHEFLIGDYLDNKLVSANNVKVTTITCVEG